MDLGDSHEWLLARFAIAAPMGTIHHPYQRQQDNFIGLAVNIKPIKKKRVAHWAQDFQLKFSAWMQGKAGYEDLSPMVGYSREELRDHMARQFTGRMSWKTYGGSNKGWVIEHIVPKRLFKSDQVAEAYALTNLRPLWAKENMRKGAIRVHLL